MQSTRHRSQRTDAGASSVEYGLLLALVAAVIVTAVFMFGGAVHSLFNTGCEKYQSQGPQANTVSCN